MNQDPVQLRLKKWLMRKTPVGGVRQVAQAPLFLSSDIGRVRQENQDRVAVLRAQVSTSRSFLVAVLCDGMGGMQDGAGCASLAVSTFLTSCIRNRALGPVERLNVAVHSANNCVNAEYHQKGGATLSAFLIDSDANFVAINIGDSRIYNFSDNKLRQMSVDDTVAGIVDIANEKKGLSNQLLQYVGIGADLDPHFISTTGIKLNSMLLMTSDGTHFVDHDTMEAIIRYAEGPAEIAQKLVEIAKWCGGADNASIVVTDSISNLLSSDGEDSPPTGSVQIWDSFGDLSLIGVEKVEIPSSTVIRSDDLVDAPVDSQHQEATKEGTGVDKSVVKKDSPRKKNIKGNTESSEKKGEVNEPQIRIDFE